jgi:hypothetical protein
MTEAFHRLLIPKLETLTHLLRAPFRDIYCRNVRSYNGISAPSSRAADGAVSQRFLGLVLAPAWRSPQ